MTPMRCFFVILNVITLLLIALELYQSWKSCSSHFSGRYGVSTARHDEYWQKKRASLSGKELLRQFDNVKTFVMFIGYPRSGHSLIGSLLDAHPEIIVPHEYNIVANWEWLTSSDTAFSKNATKYRLFYELYSLSQQQALFGRRSPKRSRTSYSYHVPGMWQGTYHKTIKVIGDKKGGGTSVTHPSNLLTFFTELENVEIPLKLIHIVRNPFDNIATIALRKAQYRDEARKVVNKTMNDSTALDWSISYYFQRATTNRELFAHRRNMILNLKSHEIIQRPRETIQMLCDHLVDACVNILYKKVSVTRNSVVWTDDLKEKVLREMKNYSFLQDFTFEDVP